MSERDDTPADDPPDEVFYAADSVSEFVERERHRQILDARKEARETLQKLGVAFGDGRRQRETRAAARASVESYALTVEEIFHQTDVGERLWNDQHIATINLPQAVEWASVDVAPGEEVVDVADVSTDMPAPVRDGQLSVVGVGAFVQLPSSSVRLSYEVELDRRGSPTETRGPTTTTFQTPIHVSREAYRATDALLAAADLGISFGEREEAEWSTDYRDDDEE